MLKPKRDDDLARDTSAWLSDMANDARRRRESLGVLCDVCRAVNGEDAMICVSCGAALRAS